MKLCGLTGGVGMGKSTAAGFLLAAGARVVDTDDLAHELVQPGQPALAEIAAVFGNHLLAPDGGLRRGELAKIVFADPAARQKLEGILHPRIRAGWRAQAEAWRRENCPVGVVVIPLLFETQAEGCFDKIICVACSPDSQRARLAARGWTPEQIRQRIAAQMPVEQKLARSHFVVWSEGLPEVSQRQLGEILGKI
ncbi:MAG: dephospho-CoA kinase [Verrucomicrobiae bacterium]|nr:dephospho-CoA kinase [Verrucomicrobiae bacterium]